MPTTMIKSTIMLNNLVGTMITTPQHQVVLSSPLEPLTRIPVLNDIPVVRPLA